MTTQLAQRLQAELNDARRLRDRERTLVLSTTLSEVRNRGLDSGGEVADEEVVQILSKAIKQRRDAAEQMRGAGRDELADGEEAQAAILQAFLPSGLSEEEVRAFVAEIVDDGAVAIGDVMGRLMPKIRGRFDGKEANRIVRDILTP